MKIRASVERDAGGNPIGVLLFDPEGIGGVVIGPDRLKRVLVGADRIVEIMFEADSVEVWKNEELPFESSARAEEAS